VSKLCTRLIQSTISETKMVHWHPLATELEGSGLPFHCREQCKYGAGKPARSLHEGWAGARDLDTMWSELKPL
jgi:hypothetical protein